MNSGFYNGSLIMETVYSEKLENSYILRKMMLRRDVLKG